MSDNGDDEQLDAVLADYIESAVGVPGTVEERDELRARLLSKYPAFSSALRSYFEDEDSVSGEIGLTHDAPPAMDRYDQVSCIGEGAMGLVYRAYDRQLKRWVALKLSRSGHRITPAESSRFHREAQSMARLRHPNIVPVFDAGEYAGHPYLSMELIDGPSLDQLAGDLDAEAIARLLVDIARAVHHAHQRELLHRDLKPSNVLLTQQPGKPAHPYVCDFGLAKHMGGPPENPARVVAAGEDPGMSGQGQVVGSACYMSPEQARGERATTLSDIYGLGAVLYTLLTGVPPYRGETLAATLAAVEDRELAVTPPRERSPGIDRTLEAICLKCLEKQPGDRYASAEGLARDLERWLERRPTEARPVGPLRRAGLWAWRNPLATGLVTVLLALLAIAGLELREELDEPRRAQWALATQRAELLGLRLDQLRQAVAVAAASPGLPQLTAAGDRDGLRRIVNRAGLERVDLNGVSPFESWFVVDRASGKILARWPAMPAGAGAVDLRARHYISVLDDATSPSGPQISHAFRSLLDGLYKFGISAPLRDEHGSLVGALVATVTTSAQMGFPVLGDGDMVTALLARRESFHALDPAASARDTSDYLLLLHPAYHRGDEPVWLPRGYLLDLGGGQDPNYQDPVVTLGGITEQNYAGPWVAVFTPVPGSDFVVIVQQRYRKLLPHFSWSLGLIALALGGQALRRLRSRVA